MEVTNNTWAFNMTKDEARVLNDFYNAWNNYCTNHTNCNSCCMHDVCICNNSGPILDRFSHLIQYHISIKED